jgi:hypothetical protein
VDLTKQARTSTTLLSGKFLILANRFSENSFHEAILGDHLRVNAKIVVGHPNVKARAANPLYHIYAIVESHHCSSTKRLEADDSNEYATTKPALDETFRSAPILGIRRNATSLVRTKSGRKQRFA